MVDKNTIPIVFMFDNNYTIPAGVAFKSLLLNSNKKYKYELHVITTDITENNRNKLLSIVSGYNNSSLNFINIGEKFDKYWKKTKVKGHFSKEIFCKFSLPSLFCQYEKLIVSDVDVVFTGDVSNCFDYVRNDNDFYVAGVKVVGKISYFMDNYSREFSEDEISRLTIGAGFMVYNLKKMRNDNIENLFYECFEQNYKRLIQPEQDVINLVCHEKIIYLPLNYMTCTYIYDLYSSGSDLDTDINYSREELEDSINNPIQLHYATHVKPWIDPSCTKSEIWYKILADTPFFFECLLKLRESKKNEKTLFSLKLFRRKSKSYYLELREEKRS